MDKLLILLRIVVGGAFIYASRDKIVHPVEFADAVMGYRIVPTELVTLVATVLPWLELLLGLGLVLGLLSVSSAAWASLLSLGFLAGKVSVILRGLDVSCGCFSVNGTSSISWSDLPANALLLLVALLLWAKGPGCWAIDRYLFEERSI
jgi:putative oxidoreductase